MAFVFSGLGKATETEGITMLRREDGTSVQAGAKDLFSTLLTEDVRGRDCTRTEAQTQRRDGSIGGAEDGRDPASARE